MKRKIKKVVPVASRTLCQKCQYYVDMWCWGKRCKECELYNEKSNGETYCACNLISYGQRCEHFKKI